MTLWRWNEASGWEPTPLCRGSAVAITPGILLVPLTAGRCALLDGDASPVNGLPPLPLRILEDRDELVLDGCLTLFSALTHTEAVVLPATSAAIVCGRCKSRIETGTQAVRCPRCQTWHHQAEALPCWTYASTCASCAYPTDGAAWQPEPLAGKASESRDEPDV